MLNWSNIFIHSAIYLSLNANAGCDLFIIQNVARA